MNTIHYKKFCREIVCSLSTKFVSFKHSKYLKKGTHSLRILLLHIFQLYLYDYKIWNTILKLFRKIYCDDYTTFLHKSGMTCDIQYMATCSLSLASHFPTTGLYMWIWSHKCASNTRLHWYDSLHLILIFLYHCILKTVNIYCY